MRSTRVPQPDCFICFALSAGDEMDGIYIGPSKMDMMMDTMRQGLE